MRTARHWKESTENQTHQLAMQTSFQIKEMAKKHNYDPRGVKLLSKNKIIDAGYGRVTAAIVWHEGPDNWAFDIDTPTDICFAHDGKTLLFY